MALLINIRNYLNVHIKKMYTVNDRGVVEHGSKLLMNVYSTLVF